METTGGVDVNGQEEGGGSGSLKGGCSRWR